MRNQTKWCQCSYQLESNEQGTMDESNIFTEIHEEVIHDLDIHEDF